MLVLFILLGIALLVAGLLLAPVRLDVTFRDSFSAKVRYLFLTFPLTGKQEEPSAASPTREEKAPASQGGLLRKLRAMLRREGLGGFLRSLEELARAVKDAGRNALGKARLRRFDAYVRVAGAEDAAAAAVLYGQVCGVVYTASGVLLGMFPCRKARVSVDLDYGAAEHFVDFSASASIRLLFLLREGLILLYKALPFFKKLQGSENRPERISRTRKQGE